MVGSVSRNHRAMARSSTMKRPRTMKRLVILMSYATMMVLSHAFVLSPPVSTTTSSRPSAVRLRPRADDEENNAHPDDPRAFRKTQRKEQARQRQEAAKQRQRSLKEAVQKRRQGLAASSAMDLPSQPLIRTIGGGTAMIFEMASRMLLWESEDLSSPPDAGVPTAPRWHPMAGVSDVNPNFRTQSPVMNNQGYAGTIWRNVRKRSKPSMWRYALRTYDRMLQPSDLRIEPSNIHHEGALVACAKLGLWERAMEIYQSVRRIDQELRRQQQSLSSTMPPKPQAPPGDSVHVTDNMILSIVRACVRATRQSPKDAPIDVRRAPLDAAQQVLAEFALESHLPLVARHVNPLAAGYQYLDLTFEASLLLDTTLDDRTSGPESEDGVDRFNVNDVHSKDKASYSLLVKGAVSDGDWTLAVDALRDMTEAGLYPSHRHLNSWTEVSERKTRNRTTRSWTKKRDGYYMESIQ